MTREEHAAILTGLRMLQEHLVKHGPASEETFPDALLDILTCGGELTPLTADQLDDVCERFNTGGLGELDR
jgi:hypothetical protein